MSDLRGPGHIVDKLRTYLCFTFGSLLVVLAVWIQFGISFFGSTFLLGSLSFVLSVASFVLWDIIRMKPARTLDLKNALTLYLQVIMMYYLAKFTLKRRYEPYCRNLEQQQLEYLLTLLKRYDNTEYGLKYKFSATKTVEDFKRLHPLTLYDHYLPYIERCIAGEKNILYSDEIVYVAMTSGTTGKNKRFLITEYEASKCLKHYILIVPDVIRLLSWRQYHLKKFVAARFYVPYRETELGVQMGPFSYLGRLRSPVADVDSSPLECWDIKNDDSNMYVQVLLTLYNRDCQLFMGIFPSVLALFFTSLEKNVDQLCDDIRAGRITEKIELEENMREKLDKRLLPWPERADEIKRICSHGHHSVAKQLWPELEHITMIQDGPFRPLALSLLGKQFAGVPNSTFSHSASEGSYGFPVPYGCYGNKHSDERIYSFSPVEAFFEFIPVEDLDDEQPNTKCLTELTVGKVYELVISNYRGLYRYRTNDLVEIMGHYQQMPLYKFSQRRGDILNVAFEKTPQVIMNECISRATKRLDITLKDFTTTESFILENLPKAAATVLEDVETRPGFYVLFMELNSDEKLDSSASDSCDKILQDCFENYASLRRRGQIQGMKVVQLKPGTFQRLTLEMVKANKYTSIIQFKLPKVMRKKECLEFLLENIV